MSVMPEVRKQMLDTGLEPASSTPEQLGELLKGNIGKLGKIIRDANIKLE
jgi:tripartite-type tricarboxylate transporter receptor subunit TctC